ncbi:MAG TPA: phosphoribosylamine--glycine ligase [Ktedonobacterales bacterium]|nr:phosphoribosylamine--glycine ligase [Ktedonobacterales bacterium]
MRVLIIGSGAREHALAWAVSRSPEVNALYCAPGNGGTAALAQNIPLQILDFAQCAVWAAEHAIDLTIIGPDDPLGGGIVDAFQQRGLRVFGPTKAAARIESSKSWAKNLMQRYHIPTAQASSFDDLDVALRFLASNECRYPLVIKADGLAAGKGVSIVATRQEAEAAITALLVERRLGAAGSTILLEEFLEGREVSFFALSDGNTILPLAAACDYKRALDGDRGLNTGGMGAYSPPGFVDAALAEQIFRTILRPTITAMAQESCPFVGVLYAGLMLTKDGPKVLEFNARLGDPETQVMLPRLQSDLLSLFTAASEQRLAGMRIDWRPEAACGVVLASAGYPDQYQMGFPIRGLNQLPPDILAFHAGTRLAEDGQLLTSGGRVMTLVALGQNVAAARKRVYEEIERVQFQGRRYRQDIAAREEASPAAPE